MKRFKAYLMVTMLLLLFSNAPTIVLAEEPSLQQWLTNNTYPINVTTNETGIETFPPGQYRVTILAEFALYAPNNTLGWHSLSAKPTFHELFSGADTVGATVEFSTTQTFGLYLGSPEGTFYTENSRSKNGADHAWVFNDPKTENGYIIAWEDLWEGGDRDYQDMIISLRLLRPPHAAFDWYPPYPQVGETVIFNASASTPDGGVIVSYKWNFGDGNITTISNPIITHKYSTYGSYTVTLNVTDSEGKWDVESKIIEVQQPPQPEFIVIIEGTQTYEGNEYEFKAPAYCTTFNAEVWVFNALDLYGYAFWLEFDPTLIQIVEHEIKHIHTDDFVVLEEVDNATGVYKQVLTAKAPAQPYSGSEPVASFQFHIIKDPCYPYNYTSILRLKNTNMTNPEGLPINHSQRHGYFKIYSVKPEISISCEGETDITNWIVDRTFTFEINLTDIMKMKGFYLEIEWCSCLETNYQNIEVTNFLPPPYAYQRMDIINDTMLIIEIMSSIEKPAVNGSGTLLRIVFRAKNPWGRVPPYRLVDGRYLPENCTCKIWLKGGWIDVYCPEYRRMELYSCEGVEVKNYCTYAFTPVPGDLNLDGRVDVVDLSAIAQWINYDSEDPEWSICYQFDLNGDNRVDLFDVVIVASNFGRARP